MTTFNRVLRRPNHDSGIGVFAAAAALVATFVVAPAAAYLTHIIWIIRHLASDSGATAGQIALGVIGILAFPIGVVHGFIIWFS